MEKFNRLYWSLAHTLALWQYCDQHGLLIRKEYVDDLDRFIVDEVSVAQYCAELTHETIRAC
jgi:hypothetical protein